METPLNAARSLGDKNLPLLFAVTQQAIHLTLHVEAA